MQLPRVRDLEVYLHEETLRDLIAVHLQAMTVVKSSEEVTHLSIGLPDEQGVRSIRFNIEPAIDTIY